MRSDRVLTLREQEIAKTNIAAVESRLGYSVTPGMLNAEDVCDDVLSLREIETTAINIEAVYGSNNRVDISWLKIIIGVGIPTLYVIIAFISELF